MREDRSSIHHGTLKRWHDFMARICQEGPMSVRSLGATGAAPPSNVFGRLFMEGIRANQPTEDQLNDLGAAMAGASTADEESDVPIGIAFLGQFIDHDLTLDATTELAKAANDPGTILNFRTPRFDLDSVYGSGPEVSPHLYDRDDKAFHLILGTPDNDQDLQRNSRQTALIGDPRNDENLFISQLHGREFVKLHNQVLDIVTNGGVADHEDFDVARDIVEELYRRRVLEEFLPAVIDPSILDPMLHGFHAGYLGGPIDWANAPDMPVEFSAAAFRFGHTMIRETYNLNSSTTDIGLFGVPAFGQVPNTHNLDFSLFFDRDPSVTPQKALKIDTKITPALISLPANVASNPANLAARNMIRGQITFNLPSGEEVAQAYFPGQQIKTHQLIKDAGLEGKTPLWFYCLAEAEEFDGKLGPVGGTIVAGTILNLMLRGRKGGFVVSRAGKFSALPAKVNAWDDLRSFLTDLNSAS